MTGVWASGGQCPWPLGTSIGPLAWPNPRRLWVTGGRPTIQARPPESHLCLPKPLGSGHCPHPSCNIYSEFREVVLRNEGSGHSVGPAHPWSGLQGANLTWGAGGRPSSQAMEDARHPEGKPSCRFGGRKLTRQSLKLIQYWENFG